MRTAIYIIGFIILSIGIAFTIRSTNIEKVITEKKEKDKDSKKQDKDEEGTVEVTILDKWEVPDMLKEISALTYINNYQFACVQDEEGKIFIYDTSTKKIEKKIPFADSGDYEGLAIANTDAYVLRADGTIFEVKNYLGSKPAVIEHKTHLGSKQDTEGLCYDNKNKRLLVTVKDTDPNSKDYKGIYSFSLANKKMDESPVFKIDLNDPAFKDVKAKKAGDRMQPAAIAIHPKTNEIYIIEGSKPKLLVLNSSGSIKELKKLKNSQFNQPEGISFSPDGTLFISNEGKKNEPGNILKLEL